MLWFSLSFGTSDSPKIDRKDPIFKQSTTKHKTKSRTKVKKKWYLFLFSYSAGKQVVSYPISILSVLIEYANRNISSILLCYLFKASSSSTRHYWSTTVNIFRNRGYIFLKLLLYST